MIFDWDDMHDSNHRLDLFHALKATNSAFRATVFAVPGLCSDAFLDGLPDWLEVVPHGWLHGGPGCSDPREAEHWTHDEAIDVLLSCDHPRFAEGWKSPGWQISDGTYEALSDLGWWCADHPDNDARRPEGLPVHVLGGPDHWHGHIHDVCGNGLAETWAELLPTVANAESFELISEVVAPWKPMVAA
jgi:hypothetical protein